MQLIFFSFDLDDLCVAGYFRVFNIKQLKDLDLEHDKLDTNQSVGIII